jgi:hypothetical protein
MDLLIIVKYLIFLNYIGVRCMLTNESIIELDENEYQYYLQQLEQDQYDIMNDPLYNTNISTEKGPFSIFKLRNMTWKRQHIPGRLIDLSKLQLPYDSVLHVLDNMHEEQIQDTIRLTDNPFIMNEQSRKVLYNVIKPNTDGPCKLAESRFMYRTTGLIKNILEFKMKNIKTIKTMQKISELPLNKMVLIVLNYNPLFRTRYFGPVLLEYRKVTNLLATVLNTTLEFPEIKQHYIHLPLNSEFYFKPHFMRAAKIITRATARFNTKHYVLMLHFINFVRHTADKSIFKEYPKDKWKNINLIFTYKNFGFIYNLQDLYNMNEKDMLLLRILNHFNTLILSQDDRVNIDLEKLEQEAEKEEITEDPDLNKNVNVTKITVKQNSVEPIPITSEDDKPKVKQIHQVAKTIETKVRIHEEDEIDEQHDEHITDKLQTIVNSITSNPIESLVKKAEVIIQPKEKPKEITKLINFPYNEVDEIKQYLYTNNYVYTIRVSLDRTKYNLDDILIPSFDRHLKLKVIEKVPFKKLEEYPYYSELTNDQIKFLKRYNEYVYLKLELIEGVVKPPKIKPIQTVKSISSDPVSTIPKKIDIPTKPIKKEEEIKPSTKTVVTRANLTKTYDYTDKESTVQRSKNLIKAIDQESEKVIEFYPDITPPQIQRFKKLSQNYKSIKTDSKGTTVQELLTTPMSTTIDNSKIESQDLKELVTDPSMLKSSIVNFDKSYIQKQLKKDIYSTLVSFNSAGLFVQDIQTTDKKDPLSHMTEYSVKVEDINGKQSTLHFSLPIIDEDGNCVINGVKQRMKKQMIALPIYQISPTRVSLASNFNKYLVERNVYKANSFNFFIAKLISNLNKKHDNSIKIGHGRNIIRDAVSFDYSNLAKMFNFLEFPLASQNPNMKFGIRFYFNYENREQEFTNQFKDEDLTDFESKYGTYCGYATYTRGIALFVDLDNQLRLIDVANDTVKFKTDIISLIHEMYLFDEKPTQIYEYVDMKLLDKKFPLIFILGFQYGLQAMLEYLKIDYKLIPRRGYTQLLQKLSTDPEKPKPNENITENSFFKTKDVQFINDIKSLGLRPNEYVITGSSALVIYNILDKNNDIDLIISDIKYKQLQQQDKIVTTKNKNYIIRDTHIDLGYDEEIFSFKDWFKNSILINGYRVANLEILKKFYEELIIKYSNDNQKIEKFQKRISLIDTYDQDINNYSHENLINDTNDCYMYYIANSKEELEVINKYGMISPKELYRVNKDLFHKVVFPIYEQQAKAFTRKPIVDDSDVFLFLNGDSKHKELNSNIIKFSFISQNHMPYITNKLPEFKIHISHLVKLTSAYKCFISNQSGIKLYNIKNLLDLSVLSQFKKEAINEAKNPKVFKDTYQNISHLNIDIHYIHFSYFENPKQIFKAFEDYVSLESTTIDKRIVKDYVLKPTDLIIHFKDYDLVFNRYPLTQSLIIAGLSFFKTDTFIFEDFEKKDIY